MSDQPTIWPSARLYLDPVSPSAARGAVPQEAELQIAERIARKAHEGQKDTVTGEPYITHVERVVDAVYGDDQRAVAWLHDVIEDSELSSADLISAGISAPVARAVVELSRIKGQPYDHYIRDLQLSGNRLAIAVKMADLRDHLRPNCPERLRPRYERALVTLGAVHAEPDRTATLDMWNDFEMAVCGKTGNTLEVTKVERIQRFFAKWMRPAALGAVETPQPPPSTLHDLAVHLGWGDRMSDADVFKFAVAREQLLRVAQDELETHKSDAPTAELALRERIAALRAVAAPPAVQSPTEVAENARRAAERSKRLIEWSGQDAAWKNDFLAAGGIPPMDLPDVQPLQPVAASPAVPQAHKLIALESQMRAQATRTSPIHADLLAFADDLAAILKGNE